MSGTPIKVLIVEDNPDLASSLAELPSLHPDIA